MTLARISIPSPNYSARGASVRLVILHTAEGALTIESLGAYFANPSAGVSSNVGIDDKQNTVGEYLPASSTWKAWTQGNANPFCVSAELCAFASWTRAEWDRHPSMLLNAAAWVAEECARFGIPCRYVSPAEAQSGVAGVTDHAALGAWGGGHWDCGSGFPIHDVIEVASGDLAGTAPSEEEIEDMIASTDGQGYWTVTRDGAVGAFGDAEYHGGAFDLDESAPGRQPMAPGTSIVGIAGHGRSGYWLKASDGGVFAFGSAVYLGRPDRH
jgi:hypothetical protein